MNEGVQVKKWTNQCTHHLESKVHGKEQKKEWKGNPQIEQVMNVWVKKESFSLYSPPSQPQSMETRQKGIKWQTKHVKLWF